MERGKTIEQIATEHCLVRSPGCIVGLMVCRNGGFYKSFMIEFPQDISPDRIVDVFMDGGVQLKTSLEKFDKGE